MALAGVGINTVSGFTASIKYALQASVENAAKEAQRLSTGNKIINAFEDAAGLVIGVGLEAETRTLKVVLRGILQGQSALYIAEAAVDSLTQISVRQKELTAAALSGVTSDKERGFIDLEFQQLNSEVTRISTTTNFNGIKLIDGSISNGGNILTDTKNLLAGAGTSALTWTPGALAPTANISTLDINGVSFRYGTGTTAGAIAIHEANDLTIGFQNITTANTAIVTLVMGTQTVTINTVTTATPSAAGAINVLVSATSTGAEIATAVAEQINQYRDTINFGKMANVSAVANGNSLTIQSGKVFLDNSVTDATYTYAAATTPSTFFTSFQVGSNPATIATATAIAATTVTDYDTGLKAASLLTPLQSDLVTQIANQINGSGTGFVALDNFSTTVLNGLSAVATPNTTTQTLSSIALTSKNTTLNGRILQTGFVDAGGTAGFVRFSDVGQASSGTQAGSLGISNISVGGSLLGTGASYLRGLGFNTASTGAITLNDGVANPNMANTQQLVVNDGAVFRIGTAPGGNIDFTFRLNPVNPNDVQIIANPTLGTADWQATMVNLVEKLRTSNDPLVKNMAYELDANTNFAISSKVADDSLNGMTFAFLGSAASQPLPGPYTPTNLATQILTMSGGQSSGLNMANISGIQGFEGTGATGINRANVSATYQTPNTITLNITSPDGSITYSAQNVNVSTGGTVRMTSTTPNKGGGSFDMDFAGGQTVGSQNDANNFATTLGDALAGLSFYQTRRIDSFTPSSDASTLNGAFAEMASKTYNGTLNVKSVAVTGAQQDPLGANRSYIQIKTSDGRTFQNIFNPGESLQYIAKGQALTLVSVTDGGNLSTNAPLDANETITIYFGNADIDMTNSTSIAALQSDLSSSFNAGQSGMTFQADSDVAVTIEVSLGSLTLGSLYGNTSYNVTTVDNATAASTAVDLAITTLLGERDTIGSYESRFNYTIQSLQSYVQNMDAARSAFLDASMPDSVEGFSKENMKTQTAISVLKQIIQTQQQLVSLVQ